MYHIVQKRNWLFVLSLLILIPGLVYFLRFGLQLGIDFTGGTRLTATFASQRPTGPEVVETLKPLALGQMSGQTAGDHDLIIRLPSVTNEQRQEILALLNTKYGGATEKEFESVGPIIGRELLQRAGLAIGLVLLAIVLYISWAFRRVNIGPVPAWAYGLAAIIALIHDVFIVIGVFAILGHHLDYEVDSLFVTALLTVLGFSVHDTIVVFDRVRERLIVGAESTFEDTVNVSLNQTLVRSINTSLTTLLVLTVLFLFGGSTIQSFVLALIIGIASGTYSSIFVAAPLLVVYERWRSRRKNR